MLGALVYNDITGGEWAARISGSPSSNAATGTCIQEADIKLLICD